MAVGCQSPSANLKSRRLFGPANGHLAFKMTSRDCHSQTGICPMTSWEPKLQAASRGKSRPSWTRWRATSPRACCSLGSNFRLTGSWPSASASLGLRRCRRPMARLSSGATSAVVSAAAPSCWNRRCRNGAGCGRMMRRKAEIDLSFNTPVTTLGQAKALGGRRCGGWGGKAVPAPLLDYHRPGPAMNATARAGAAWLGAVGHDRQPRGRGRDLRRAARGQHRACCRTWRRAIFC